MTASSTVEKGQVDVDQRTRDELAPRCDGPFSAPGTCPNPATWIAWGVIARTGRRMPPALLCNDDLTELVEHVRSCLCGRGITLQTDRL